MTLRVKDWGHLVWPEAPQGLAVVHQLPSTWPCSKVITDGRTPHPQRSQGQLQGSGQALLCPGSPQAVSVTRWAGCGEAAMRERSLQPLG